MRNKQVPLAGQESVWDYPRPPRLERTTKRIVIEFGGQQIADSTGAYRVLETSHPPVYYIPPEDIKIEFLQPVAGSSFCEWKGGARYCSVVVGDLSAEKAAWYYANPTQRFESIKNYVAFYAQKMDRCFVDGEVVIPQPGEFYGGWITKDIVGPFKGEPGSEGW
jgi:uncharacterized protein (DUF427 family)